MGLHRDRALSYLLLLSITLAASQVNLAQAQETTADKGNSLAKRERLYKELARDVTALEKHGNLLKRAVRLVKPTVVHIDARKPEEFSPNHKAQEETGSGVIISHKDHYYVLTNLHVIRNAPRQNIKIRLNDGRVLYPEKLWADRGTDIAVMSIAGKNLIAAHLGKSEKLEIGDFVLAVGSPFGLSHSVTYGIISAKGRRDLRLGDDSVRFQDFLQTDAAINPGNSGGPLLNLRGEVIGINTAIATNSGGNDGIGFSIPIDMVMVVAGQLIENGRMVRAYLGVHLDSKFGPEDAVRLGMERPVGALVSGVTANSPASDADLHIGDVILKFNGTQVEDDNHLVNQVSLTPVGKKVSLVILRAGKPYSLKVTVKDRGIFQPEP